MARVSAAIDTNTAFSRAYNAFMLIYNTEPDWKKAKTKVKIRSSSVICEIYEE